MCARDLPVCELIVGGNHAELAHTFVKYWRWGSNRKGQSFVS